MKMYDSDGTPSHAVISKLQNISQHVKIFTEVLQKSVGIDVDDEYQVEVYSFYKGIFEMADGDDSDVTLIEADVVGPDSDSFITGDGTKTLAILVAALTEDYTITGDETQVPASGVVLAITGGVSTASARAARNVLQERFAELIATDATAIKTFYNAL